MRTLRLALAAAIAVIALLPALAAAAGPPYPDPVNGQAVYDTANALRPDTVTALETAIDAFEVKTGAEVVVYTQLVPSPRTTAEAEALFTRFHDLLTGPPDEKADAKSFGKLAVFSGVREFPVRVKCATLAWHTLHSALAGGGASASTE